MKSPEGQREELVGGVVAAVLALPGMLRPGGGEAGEWIEGPTWKRVVACLVVIVLGGAAFGYSLGLWRAGLMGGYVAVKLPLLVLLTLVTNGLLNGLLAQLLGSGFGFRQTVQAQLMSFALFALITGALSPVTAAMAWGAPGPGERGGQQAYQIILLTQTLVIAYAGVTSCRRFLPLLERAAETVSAGRRVFFAWLAGNLFVGAQLSWNLRPFFGQPGRPVEFLRADWNRSSFYEAIWRNVASLAEEVDGGVWWALVGMCGLVVAGLFHARVTSFPLTQQDNERP